MANMWQNVLWSDVQIKITLSGQCVKLYVWWKSNAACSFKLPSLGDSKTLRGFFFSAGRGKLVRGFGKMDWDNCRQSWKSNMTKAPKDLRLGWRLIKTYPHVRTVQSKTKNKSKRKSVVIPENLISQSLSTSLSLRYLTEKNGQLVQSIDLQNWKRHKTCSDNCSKRSFFFLFRLFPFRGRHSE